ncbi:B12-binding domain-containing protein [Rhodopirellula sallentina]|uniref:DNA binding domain-containing protein, excisionase family n=1 Tax=Rhodopirellula sallentina SM41 TaxID=1263870 RepID=M5U7Z4_9BACT|nr:B12-binding domain-containing protein [Rhodopirellula sallentina]EMI57565.1 DNA binding domain-containing protein, excisionase family [Rhodopirellula sallentina SM41]
MKKWLTVSEGAERLGVSASTFKRWCSRHEIDLERTPGGHRRISQSNLEQLVQEIGTEPQRRSRGDLSDSLATANILALLKTRKATDLRDLVLEACRDQTDITTVLDHSLAPAMWQVGTLWQRGELQVYEERMCTETMMNALDLLSPFFQTNERHAITAVGGCLHQGSDTLASKFVSLSLNSIGVMACDLGPRLPAEELAAAATALDTRIVWSTNTHWDDRTDTLSNYQNLHRNLNPDTYLFIGGGGLSSSARKSLDFCEFFETLGEMASFVKRVVLNQTTVEKTQSVSYPQYRQDKVWPPARV